MESPFVSEAEAAGRLDDPKRREQMPEAMVEHAQGTVIPPLSKMVPIRENQRYRANMPVAASAGMGGNSVAFYRKNAGTEHHTHPGGVAFFAATSDASIHAQAADVIDVISAMSGAISVERSQTTVCKSVGVAVRGVFAARCVDDRHRGAHG